MFSKEEKRMRNKVTLIALICYIIGFVLTMVTRMPLFILFTIASVPICLNTPIKNWIKQ